ncbi:MAG: DUF4870 domain-containing protein [Burkholderiales bacterium]|nr:DUF4870 domain-containing protein [Burkholderiales bacterium]
MNDVVNVPGAAGKTPEEMAGLKNITMVVYALQALTCLWGVTAIVAIVINYVKRDDVRGTIYESHFDWQIRTFWWGLLGSLIGMALVVVLLGFPILIVVWIWMVYRVVKGWLKLNEGKPVYPA